MKISEKDIGKRVVVNGKYDYKIFNNDLGVLKCLGPITNKPGIVFDKPRAGFHDLNKHCKNGHGYYVPESMITFIEEENEMDMDFQVGDEVEHLLSVRKGKITQILPHGMDIIFYGDVTSRYYPNLYNHEGHVTPLIYHSGSIKREGSKIIIDPVKPEREKWVNVYLDSRGEPYLGPVHDNKQEAEKRINSPTIEAQYVATIQLKRNKP